MQATTHFTSRLQPLLCGAGATALLLCCPGLATAQLPGAPLLTVYAAASPASAFNPSAAAVVPGADPSAPPAPPQASSTPPQGRDDLFAGTEKFAKGATDVTEVNMDPRSLDMVDGNNAGRAHSMILNVVRTYEYDKPGMYNMADVDEFRKRLDTGDWHCSVHSRNSKTGESTDICAKQRTDGLVEKAIITVEPKELTFIHTIRRPNPNGGHGGPGDSLLVPPASLPEGEAIVAAAQARLASLGPELAARSASLQREMEAHRDELRQLQQRLEHLHVDAPPTPAPSH